MNEDNKKYTFEGTVEISSREYRDLIEELETAKAEVSKSNSDYWRIRSEKDKVESQLEKLTVEFECFKKFIASNTEISQKYWEFRYAEKKEEEDD